ncbi:uroporphyrinogen-III C-methyltransferase [Candidatus Hecatella orcuttiae]|jgi:uroporphyrinogen III methyltransferase/synthase|uniref:uroporphyrinogen-III C-methyltransferase n=1 Tax=Candidatus Hecatella orcuttiae TaxID=1935119 RepID=UPI0028681161|nr:uroporphyrinogen-III C-methyltransferase [Candidatus Hecatella orcuttiae]
MKKGKVFLVGAGPGDPELLTLKALKILKKADVVVYDRLIARASLKLAPRKAKKIYVGKAHGSHTIPQEAIHKILVEEASEGKTVVRLKGGDPFLFGRGGEEAQELRRAKIPFEVVPGVTSALAVPAYAGIPLTHRNYASSVAIVTGHEDPRKRESWVKWDKIAASVDTIVVLMGAKRLGEIVKSLLEGGRSPQTPVVLIEEGTTKRQRKTLGTLGDIVKKASRRKVKPPAVIVVGDIVHLHKELSWFKP